MASGDRTGPADGRLATSDRADARGSRSEGSATSQGPSEGSVTAPDVTLRGEWPVAPVPKPVAATRPGDNSSGRPRNRRETPGRALVSRSRQWRPSAVLAVLLFLASVLILLDLRGGLLQPVRAFGADLGGSAQLWADGLLGPVRDSPLRRPDQAALSARIAELEQRNSELELSGAMLAEQIRGGSAVRELLRWGAEAELAVTPAQVVAVDSGRGPSQSVTINAGRGDGIREDQAVVGGGALVGRIVSVGRATAVVQLISDPGSQVWGRFVETRESAIVAGTGDGLTLRFLDPLGDIRPGQRVVTMGSADSSPYPRGLPLAEVTTVSGAPGDYGRTARAVPMVDLGTLDVVGVLAGTKPGNEQ